MVTWGWWGDTELEIVEGQKEFWDRDNHSAILQGRRFGEMLENPSLM